MRSTALLLALAFALPMLAGCVQETAPPTPAPAAPTTGDETPAPDADAPETARSPCGPRPSAAPPEGSGTVTLLTHDSFSIGRELPHLFHKTTGYTLDIVKLGDAGEALNKAILTKGAPLGDALFGVDDNLILRANAADLFDPYTPHAITDVAPSWVLPFCADGATMATPVSYGYVQLNYDPAWFAARGLEAPTDLAEIASATYAPLTVVQNPYTSSPGEAFFYATIDRFGEDGEYPYTSWWRDFAANGGKIVAGWEEAYGSDFTQGWDEAGALDRPIVVSYSTSPAYNPLMGYTDEATSANLDLPKGAWLQIESIGVLRNAPNPAGAKALVEFLLSAEFQAAIPTSFVTYPVLSTVPTPEAYALYAPEPTEAARVSPALIAAKRADWLDAWRDATGQV